jgi:hypothetical protein
VTETEGSGKVIATMQDAVEASIQKCQLERLNVQRKLHLFNNSTDFYKNFYCI